MEREGWEVTLDLHARCDRADICRSTGSTPDRGAKEREREKAELVKSSRIFGVFAFFFSSWTCVYLSLAAQCPARGLWPAEE